MCSGRETDARIAFVRICADFFSSGAWPEEGRLIRNAHRPACIAGVLVQGRHDVGCPVRAA
jgi:proline iminopeptidase